MTLPVERITILPPSPELTAAVRTVDKEQRVLPGLAYRTNRSGETVINGRVIPHRGAE